jgi:hypothetical protein
VVQVQHRFGGADVARAEALANPSAEDCLQLAAGLRGARAELRRDRAELAAKVRAAWGVGPGAAQPAGTDRLRALEGAIAANDDALDRVLELLRPGAERYRDKRTRAAALAVARERVEVLRRWLAAQGVEGLDARFEAKSPSFDVAQDDAPGTALVVLRRRQ